jgi:hypothetical protein
MILPATFKKIQGNPCKVNHEDTASIGGGKGKPGGKGGPECDKRGKKRGIDQELTGSIVKNNQQCNDFKLAVGKMWEDFRAKCPKSRMDWNNLVKMCARRHIKGSCFDNYPRTISHGPCSKVPPKEKNNCLTFMGECRACIIPDKHD